MIEREGQYGQLVQPFDMVLQSARNFYLVYSNKRQPTFGMESFRDWLMVKDGRVSRNGYWQSGIKFARLLFLYTVSICSQSSEPQYVLYIAEKPSLGRAIADVLPRPHKKEDGCIRVGNGDVVTWCIGHLLEQAEPDAYDPAYKKWMLEACRLCPSNGSCSPSRKPASS